MSTLLTKHKNLILSLLLIAVVLAGVFGAGHGVFAQQQPPAAQPQAGNATPQTDLSYWYGVIVVILEFIRTLLTKILAFAAYFLDVAFNINVGYVPSYDPIVQAGWIVLRDLVNGMFIILVLWIALTIILGVEQYGGKKLLVKVLAVAVLINFSLAIVASIVALSNQFSLALYNKIFSPGQEKDLAGMIIQFTQVQSAVNFLADKQRDDLVKSMTDTPPPTPESQCGKTVTATFSSWDCFWNGPGLLKPLIKSIPGKAGTAAAQGLGIPEKSRLQALSTAIGAFIFLIITSAFVYAAIALWLRLFALMLLAIFSPVAIIALILPIPIAREGWDKWQQEFLKWVFFGPVFYFLMYLSLLMAYTMNNAVKPGIPAGSMSIGDDARLFLAYTIVIIMLVVTGRYAKKSAGKAGEITVGLAKKAAGLAVGVTAGVATGGTLMAARAVARGAAREGGVAEKMAGSKVGRMFGGGVLLRKGVQLREERKQQIEERAKKYDPYSVSQMQAEVRGTGNWSTQENAARILALAKKTDGFKGFDESEMKRVKDILKHYNRAGDITKINATLADRDTIGAKGRGAIVNGAAHAQTDENLKPIQLAAEGLTSTEMRDNLDLNSLKGTDAKNKAVRDGILANSRFTHHQLEQMVQKDFAAAQEMVDAMGEFLDGVNGGASGYDTQTQNLNNQIARANAGGNTARAAALTTQKNNLESQKRRLEGTKRYLTTAPGGQALGLAPQGGWTAPAPTPISFTGNRVINTQAGRSVAVDLTRSVTGGTGTHTFSTAPGSGFIVGADGILKTDPTMSLMPGIHTVTIAVTDAAGATTNINLTVNINP